MERKPLRILESPAGPSNVTLAILWLIAFLSVGLALFLYLVH